MPLTRSRNSKFSPRGDLKEEKHLLIASRNKMFSIRYLWTFMDTDLWAGLGISHSNSGVSLKHPLMTAAGYLSPWTSASSTTLLTSAFSSSVSFTSNAPQFSSRYLIFLVPGIGMISSPCASSHAKVSCPGVTFFFFAISASFSTTFRFLGKFSSEKRGTTRRKSPFSKSLGDLYCPVMKPRPRGL